MECKLGDICRPKQWKTVATSELSDKGYPVYGANGKIGYYKEYNHKNSTILVTCRGATCGKINISDPFSYVNGNAMALDDLNSAVEFGYLLYFLKNRDFSDIITGSAQPQIIKSSIEKVKILLPPINEQKRIVEKLDAILPKVKQTKERLENISTILKRFRQSVLVAAFDGRLTGTTISKKEKLEELCYFITKGTTPKEMASGKGEIPFIKVYNLTFTGALDFTLDPTFVSRKTHDSFLARSKVVPGDILMNIVGPPLGKVSLLPDSFGEANINQAIVRFRCKDLLSNKYLLYFLLNQETIETITAQSKATVGQNNLTLEICRNIEIPLTSIDKQQEIVCRVEKLFAVADALEEKYQSAMSRVNKIEQAVLAKAFRGELAEADPDDESAEELLDGILGDK
ncbi:hypothetical protein FACS189485_15420 [Spirochaetia bacterium]|nr:hypothetical protein FACS189485_15420 [Spirochaetia bacterium]